MIDYTMTKIVATLGPATSTKEKIRELFKAGVTMFRLNSSHEAVDVHQRNLNWIREIEQEENIKQFKGAVALRKTYTGYYNIL